MSKENWRIPVTGADYLLHQKKTLEVADRRPVIRQASDLVGPGISGNAVRITDFDDLLATFNGYYSAAAGANGAPDDSEPFVGYVISDAELGGRQVFTGLVSGNEYSRTFTRSPTDPETLGWSNWSGQRVRDSARGYERTPTYCQPGQVVVLAPPTSMVTIGDDDTYERSDGGIRIRKQGIYTGHIQVGDYTGTGVGDIYARVPNDTATTDLGQLGCDLGPTVNIPFTVWATGVDTAFSVIFVMDPAATAGLYIWWRFACTRVGDAV